MLVRRGGAGYELDVDVPGCFGPVATLSDLGVLDALRGHLAGTCSCEDAGARRVRCPSCGRKVELAPSGQLVQHFNGVGELCG